MLTNLQLAVLGLGVAVHAGFAYYLYRQNQSDASVLAGIRNDQRDDVDARPRSRVECPNCGTENDQFYRYCRDCVTELPGTAPFVSDTGSPLRRTTR